MRPLFDAVDIALLDQVAIEERMNAAVRGFLSDEAL